MKIAYFVGGCLAAIAFSNFLKILARVFPNLNLFVAIVLLVAIAVSFGVAMFWKDSEQGLTGWFVGLCAIGLGVMLGAI